MREENPQMHAPVYEALEQLKKRRVVPFDVPGHKRGRGNPPVTVKEGERFAVVVELTTPDSVHPLAIEYAADETTENVDLSDGEGYISAQGNSWENVESGQNCNLCIKAYGRNQQ